MTAYWINETGDALCQAILLHFRQFEEDLWRTGDYARMELSRLAYYGQDEDGTSTATTQPLGAEGQARSLRTNEYRRAITNKLGIALADPPETMPVPANTDTESVNAARIAVAFVDSYLQESADSTLKETAEMAECLGWGWLVTTWDDGVGEPLDAVDSPDGHRPVLDENGGMVAVQKVLAGDLRIFPALPVDVAFEMQSKNSGPPGWVIIKSYENKFKLAAELENARPGDPQAAHDAETIRGLKDDTPPAIIRFGRYFSVVHTDEVSVYELRARDSAAVPGGRVVRMTGQNIILPIPHLERAAAADLLPRPDANPFGMRMGEDLGCEMSKQAARFGTPRGYTDSHDCLGLQRAHDVLTSVAYSNQRALGGNIIFAQKGSGFDDQRVNEALTVVWVNDLSRKPEVAELLHTPKEVFEFRETVAEEIAQQKGLNSVSQGTDTRALSGSAMALLDTQTQRAVGNTAAEAWRMRQWLANTIVQQVQRFGRGTRRAVLRVGKASRPRLMELKPDDLKGLYRVDMQRVSAIQRSPAGRLQMAQDLLASRGPDGKPNLNAEQYVAVVTTGKLEPLTEGPMSELQLIRSENERLAMGEVLDAPGGPVQAMAGDDHPLHIREHDCVLASPEARANPAVVQAVALHQQAHATLWRTVDPALLAAKNIMPPPPPPGMLPPGPGGPPVAPGQPEPGKKASGAPSPPASPPEAAAPSMPANPSTGEQWSPTGAVPNA